MAVSMEFLKVAWWAVGKAGAKAVLMECVMVVKKDYILAGLLVDRKESETVGRWVDMMGSTMVAG